jgi:hypothetical protein
MNYAIFDSEGKCINNVEWNGDTSIWSPPDGCTAVPDAERQHPIAFSSESTGTDSLDGLTETQKQAIRDIIEGK